MPTIDRVAGAALALFALGVLAESRKLPLGSLHNPGPAYMPTLLALVLLVLAILLAAAGGGRPIRAVAWTEWRHAVVILGTCAFAALALERLGYRLTVAVALAVLLGVMERRGIVVAVVFAVVLALGSFFLFDTLLRVPLPVGPFGL
jgi:putative tricarboxylic transport membrane protein